MKNGSDAFQKLYDANHKRVIRFLTRIAGPQEAEDLVQVVFAKAARGLPSFRGDAKTSSWLYRIAANVASDWIRQQSALVRLPNALDHAVCDPSMSSTSQENQASPEQELIRKEMQVCIRRVIGQLPDTHRTVLMLGELGGFTDNEIAQTLGLSRGNAKVRLHRARAQLKNALKAHCDFSRNEDNELVCEPKPATCNASSKLAGRPPNARLSSEAV